MRGIKRRVALLSLAAVVVSARELAAQQPAWRLNVGAAQSWFGGGAQDTAAAFAQLHYVPTSAVTWTVGVDRDVGKLRLGLALSYAGSYLHLDGTDYEITDETISMQQFEVALLARVPVLAVGSKGAGFDLAAGPVMDIWSITSLDGRTALGGVAALEFGAPISPAWQLLTTASVSATGSPFRDSDMLDEAEPQALWTWGVGLGLRIGL